MRLRLLDAVIIAAIGLLGLKTMGVLTSDISGPDRTDFGRMLTFAHSDYAEPEVTGAVPKTTESAKPEDAKRGDGKADEVKPNEVKPEAARTPPASLAGGRPVSLDPGAAGLSAAERGLLESLSQRRDELDARQRELDMRESLLATAEKKLEARLGDLKALEGRVSADDRDGAEGQTQTTKSLVTMYETMKPKEAARVFDRLSREILVPVVVGMNPRKMAEVLAAMSPEAAQKLTVALANRSKTKSGEGRAGLTAPISPTELPAIDPTPAWDVR